MSAEDIAHRVLDNLRLLVAVVTCKLREVLEAETDGHLVASGGRNQVVDTTEIDGRKLVDDDGTFQLSFLVHQFDDARIVQAESRRIDILPVRIIAHAEDFGVFGIVQVKGEIVSRHHPVKLWRDHSRKRDFRTCYLALELVLSSTLPCVHKGGKIVFEGRIRGKNREDIGIRLVKKFDCMRERAILSVLVNPQIPDDCGKQDNR